MNIMSNPDAQVVEQLPVMEEQVTSSESEQEQAAVVDDVVLGVEIEEELIIEDFTIDGICGVY